MTKRKHLDLPKTTTEILANVIGYSVFVITIALMVFGWDSLPEKIPAHFNAVGEVDRYGTAIELLILPVIGILVGVALEALERRPEVHNYPIRLNDTNRAAFYLNSRIMLNLTKNAFFVVFSISILEMMHVAIVNTSFLGGWLFPINLVLIFGPVVYGIAKRMKIK